MRISSARLTASRHAVSVANTRTAAGTGHRHRSSDYIRRWRSHCHRTAGHTVPAASRPHDGTWPLGEPACCAGHGIAARSGIERPVRNHSCRHRTAGRHNDGYQRLAHRTDLNDGPLKAIVPTKAPC